MDDVTDEELRQARALADELWATEPRASSARYDKKSGRVVVELTNGSTFMFPARLAQGLTDASDDDLAQITLMGDGFALHWETLNEGFTVPGLMAGIFGTRKYMAQLAGRAKSPKKAAAARANGRKGGRPRKTAAATPPPDAETTPPPSASGKARAAAGRRGTSR